MTRSLLLAAALAVGLTGCDFAALESSADNFKIILGIESHATVVGGLVVDAATGETVDAPVTVTYTSDTAGAVVDGFGDPIDGETVEGGGFNFAIANDLAPSAGREVRVAVHVQAEGYLPQRRVIALADTGAYDLTVELLSPERPPAGAETTSGTAAASSESGTQEAVTVSTDDDASDDGQASASVTVPAGTVFTDDAGQPVSGDVEVRLTSVDPAGPAAAALPDEDPGSARLGLVSLSARVGGRSVAPRDGLPTTIRFAAGARNPQTGRPIAPGDRVQIKRYDAEAGAWVWVAEATVDAAASGRVANASARTADGGSSATFDADGTSEYSASVEASNETLTVTVERNGTTGSIPVTVETTSGPYRATLGAGVSSVSIEVPAGSKTGVYATVRGERVSAANAASCTSCVITLEAPPEPIAITLTPECPNAAHRAYLSDVPSMTVYARRSGTQEAWFAIDGGAQLVEAADGSIDRIEISTTSLDRGARYDGKTTYLGETYEASYDVPASGAIEEVIEVPGDICQ